MRVLGFEINRAQRVQQQQQEKSLNAVNNRGWFRVFESFAGAWQSNVTIDQDTVLAYSTVFACVTLIAQDIGKLRVKLVEQQKNGIWAEITSPAYSPVLRKPNHYQTRVKFWEYWMVSKLIHGNAYALKQRDQRGIVRALYLLDPTRVTPLVSDAGEVFYQLSRDELSELFDTIIVPAREIIHDPMVTLFHPLVGVTPIYACGLAAMQGVRIQTNSEKFFANQSRPGGILTAPGAISDETAARLKAAWDTNYGGENYGKVAVVGDGLKYEAMTVNAADAQLIEQLKMSAETVCSCFHVPPYMVGVGPTPTYNNVEALNQQYYAQCLQSLIESAELCLDEGLDLVTANTSYGTMFDIDGLLRMDTATRFKSHSDAIAGGWMAPNEARMKEDYAPVIGGETPYLQQQNYSLAALSRRDTEDLGEGDTLDTAEVPQLQAIVIAAATGQIPADTARAMLAASFPDLTPEQIEAIIEPIEETDTEEVPPTTPPVTPPVEPPAEEPLEPEDTTKELLEYLASAFDQALAA